MIPKRIQRKRTEGWRMPKNTVYVGRPSKWGNPFKAGSQGVADNKTAVALFCDMLKYGIPEQYPLDEEIQKELRGKNLSCWCKEGTPCHADILLRIANA